MRAAGPAAGRRHRRRAARPSPPASAPWRSTTRSPTVIADGGGTSNFLHYGARGADPGFPATICASVNDEVVHGIPSATRILRDG